VRVIVRNIGPLDHGSREWRGNAVLRHDLNCAELLEVMIERESLSDSELLDDNLARAVCEAPVLVGETLKCLPGAFEIRLGNLMDFRNTIAKESRPK